MTAGSVAWANMEYADSEIKAKSPRDTSKQDQFVVVEDGVVEVDVLDTKTNRRHTHTLWPKDFVYCNERPGAHPLDSAGQFASTVVLALRPVTAAQLTLVHGDVFSQAMSQPSMQQVNTYLVEQFRGEVETVSSKGRIPTHDLVARNGEAL